MKKIIFSFVVALLCFGGYSPINFAKADNIPTISNVSVSTRVDGATVTWTTNVPTDSSVSYTDLVTANSYLKNDTIFTTNHSVSLSGLIASRSYKYSVAGKDLGGYNVTSSDDQLFTTLTSTSTSTGSANVIPTISNVNAVAGVDGATVTWTTNVPTNSSVDYTDLVTAVRLTKSDNSLTTNHSALISGLEASRSYEYSIFGKDANGFVASALEQIFTTKAKVAVNEIPFISNIKVVTRTNEAIVTWNTSVPASSIVRYVDQVMNISSTKTDNSLATNHSVVVSELTASRDYKFYISSKDANDYLMTSSFDGTIVKTLNGNVLDSIPTISNVSVSARVDGATVTWTTNVPTDSSVSYTDLATANSYLKSDAVLAINHSISLSGLAASHSYKYSVSGKDSNGYNVTSSDDQRFTTKEINNNGLSKNLDDSDSAVSINTINFTTQANSLNDGKIDQLLSEINSLKNAIAEQANQIKYLSTLLKGTNISADAQNTLNNFITYGSDINTKKLGAGERAAVIASYKSAFDKLPTTEAELTDVVKIANGRWPSITSADAEAQAKIQFKKIYQREADMNNANDNAAITIMAYGLRQKAENRNLNSEANGIKTFKAIYGHTPKTTDEWNIMQAITYSGASR